jgi:hypothetical protein
VSTHGTVTIMAMTPTRQHGVSQAALPFERQQLSQCSYTRRPHRRGGPWGDRSAALARACADLRQRCDGPQASGAVSRSRSLAVESFRERSCEFGVSCWPEVGVHLQGGCRVGPAATAGDGLDVCTATEALGGHPAAEVMKPDSIQL